MSDRSWAFQGVMILAGTALIISGLNGNRHQVIAGGALVFLAGLGRLFGGRPQS